MTGLQRQIQQEVNRFAASIHYRDYSRHFDVQKAPAGLKQVWQDFNKINNTFRLISRERETHFQYLQKILELVDTGIISYQQETGETGLINESFKLLMGIPYLKRIQALERREPLVYLIVNDLNLEKAA